MTQLLAVTPTHDKRQVRPVIVAGSRSFVEKAIKEAEGQFLNLRDRAVSGEAALGGEAAEGQCWGRGQAELSDFIQGPVRQGGQPKLASPRHAHVGV